MARINIEASAALAEWIDLYRGDPGRRLFQRAKHEVAAVTNYVEKRDKAYWIAGSRVSLDSVIYAFLEGSSPESIVDSFDTLSLEQVYGAIYYLSHRSEVDAYPKNGESDYDALCRQARALNPLLYQKLDRLKHQAGARRS
jgi:Protein of unknown function (DUF433)